MRSGPRVCRAAAVSWVLVVLALPAVAQAVTLSAPANYGAGNRPFGVALGDFNADADLDVVVANQMSDNVSVLLGGSGATFGAQTTFAAGADALAVATGNFNGETDSDPDLAVATASGAAVLLGATGGTFAAQTTYSTGGQPRSVAIADFNADADPDLAVASLDGNSVSVLLGGAGGAFGAATDFAAGPRPYGVAAGDFNGDSDPDLAVALQGLDDSSGDPIVGKLAVLLGGAAGSFGAAATIDIGNDVFPIAVAVGDFNGDADPDLALANFYAGTISVLTGGMGGSFSDPTSTPAGGGSPRSIAIADFNADGDPDLAVALQGAGAVALHLGASGATFEDPAVRDLGTNSPIGASAGDFDADGDPDIAVANFGDNNVSIVRSGPDVPVVSGPSPASPANDETPKIIGTAEAGTTVKLYTTEDCTGSHVASGTAAEFAAGLTVSVTADSTTTFRARASFAAGGPSECSLTSATYVEDSTDPPAPQLTATTPPSPSSNNTVRVFGTAENGSTVRVFTNADCSGDAIVSGPQGELTAGGFETTVPSDTTSTFSATARDAAGNTSGCSAPLTYVEDSTPPPAPAISATVPESGANDNSPEAKGTAGGDATQVQLFTNADCSGQPAATGTAAAFGDPGITIDVPDDALTEFRATATDSAGNVSACSPPRAYVEISTPPTARLHATPNTSLTDDVVTFDASTSTGIGITLFEWDLDGDGVFETVTGSTPTAARVYATPAEITVGVRVSNALGLSSVASRLQSIRLRPPPGLVGVSILDGQRYTNTPDVTVRVIWPRLAMSALFSNDGGFASAVEGPVAAVVPWTLDSSGPERLPKTIYVRFRGGEAGAETYQDDIILDQTPPEIVDASAAPSGGGASAARAAATAKRKVRYRLSIRARDRTSGVRKMQITDNRRTPGRLRNFARRTTYRTAKHSIYVRVMDGATNLSRWRRLRAGRLGSSRATR